MQHTYASTIAFAVGFASALCIISPIISSGLQSAVSDSDTMISAQRSSKRHGSCRVIDIHRHSCIIALRSDFHLKINESASDVRCVCINWWKLSHVRSCTSPSIVVAQWDSGTVEQWNSGTAAHWYTGILAPIAVMLLLPRNGYVSRTVLVNKCASKR